MRMFLGGSKGFSLYEDGDVTQACGQGVLCLVRTADAWLISYGINDERCAIATVAHSDFLSSVEPVPD